MFRLSFGAHSAGDVDDMFVCSELRVIVLKRYRGQWFVEFVSWLRCGVIRCNVVCVWVVGGGCVVVELCVCVCGLFQCGLMMYRRMGKSGHIVGGVAQW